MLRVDESSLKNNSCKEIFEMGHHLRLYFIFSALVSINTLVIPQRYGIINARINSMNTQKVKTGHVKSYTSKSNKLKTVNDRETNWKESQVKERPSNYPNNSKKNLFLTSLTISLNQEGTKTEKRYVYMNAGKKIYAKQKARRPKSHILSFWG